MQKRKYMEKLSIAGNVYPITSCIYLESDTTRLSILTGQSLGSTSQNIG